MRIVTWNVRRAGAASAVWSYHRELDPCFSLLQEVTEVPADIRASHYVAFERAVSKTGRPQSFGNAILSKLPLSETASLFSDTEWVNEIRGFFAGNLLVRIVTLAGGRSINLMNVYSPAWPVPTHLTEGIDLTNVILSQNPKLWCTEILWKLLADSFGRHEEEWIIGGDFNSSETFDYLWGPKPRGNLEAAQRMNALGLRDALKEKNGCLVPTFRSPRNGKVLHQMDHLYVSEQILAGVERCIVPDTVDIFDANLSDHLPIIADVKFL